MTILTRVSWVAASRPGALGMAGAQGRGIGTAVESERGRSRCSGKSRGGQRPLCRPSLRLRMDVVDQVIRLPGGTTG